MKLILNSVVMFLMLSTFVLDVTFASTNINNNFYVSPEDYSFYSGKVRPVQNDSNNTTITQASVKQDPNQKYIDDTPLNRTDKYSGLRMPNIDWGRVSTMSPVEFGKLYNQTRDYAMSNRTLANYATYAKLQDVMFERADEFKNNAVMYNDIKAVHVDNIFESQLQEETEQRKYTEFFSRYNKKYGIGYFFSNICPHCIKEEPVINMFVMNYRFQIHRINLQQEPDVFAEFGVNTTPTILLVDLENNKFYVVSVGSIILSQLTQRVYNIIDYLENFQQQDINIQHNGGFNK